MNFKAQLLTLLCALAVLPVAAQEELINLELQARADFIDERIDGGKIADHSGFKGRYLNIQLSGTIDDHFSYSYRQRLNREHLDKAFFNATDWIYLDYHPTERWKVMAGKLVVAIGGYEYDRTPIDNYFYSGYCNQIACYQWGAAVTHTLQGGRDHFTAQITQSPAVMEGENLYAYNLMWAGKHGWFESLYSINALQCAPKSYLWLVALGNRFRIGESYLNLDLTLRHGKGMQFGEDFTLSGEWFIPVGGRVQLVAKASYDLNRSDAAADWLVTAGSELTSVSGVVEFYPLKGGNRAVCLHAAYAHTFGTNTHPAAVLHDRQGIATIGLRWRMNLLRWKRS